MRANGYIPVGTTGYQLATSTTAGGIFYQNYMLPVNGLDAALGGADLELGAYIPALSQWAGMINIGGYAYGNTRYTKVGSVDGVATDTPLVPWFGGVYTRLDMTFANNWDFSLQYNNDSYFNSTGFARLTYRMGGSRRRNVPDQMEQPMFRNEHVVRAHQTPIAALNPQNGNQFWEVVHVKNDAAPNGNGTVEAPFRTLAEAQASSLVSNNPWTITYVHEGTSSSTFNAYTGSFAFQQQNQFLVGSGGSLTVAIAPVAGETLLDVPAITAQNPVLSNNVSTINDGASILIADGNGGATIANITTSGSIIGIDARGDLNGVAQPIGTTANKLGSSISRLGGSSVRNVLIEGNGTAGDQSGVRVAAELVSPPTIPDSTIAGTEPSGGIEFSDTQIANTAGRSFQVGLVDSSTSTTNPAALPNSGGTVNIDYYGSIKVDRQNNGGFDNLLVGIAGKTGGTINLTAGGTPIGASVQNELLDIGGEGIFILGNTNTTSQTINNIGNLTIVNPQPPTGAAVGGTAITLLDDSSTTSITSVATSSQAFGITKSTGDSTILIRGGSPTFSFFGTINNATATTPTGNGPIISIGGKVDPSTGIATTMTGATITIGGPGIDPLRDSSDGVLLGSFPTITPASGPIANSTITIDGLRLRGSGVQMNSVTGGTTTFSNLDINVATSTTTPAFIATDGGIITVDGISSITNPSTTQFVIQTAGANDLQTMEFNRVISGQPIDFPNPAFPPILPERLPNIAVDFSATTTGVFTITDEFTLGGAPGTLDNIDAGGVTISPLP